MRKLRVLPARPHNESNNFVLANSVKTVLTVLRQVSLPQLIWPKSESFYFLSFLLKAVWNTPTCQAYTRHQKSQILLLYQLTILTPTHNFTHCMRWKMNNIAPKNFEFYYFTLREKRNSKKGCFSGALYSVCLNTSLVFMSLAKFLRSIVGCILLIKLDQFFTSFNLYPSCKGRLFNW